MSIPEISLKYGYTEATIRRVIRLYYAALNGDTDSIDKSRAANCYKTWARQYLPTDAAETQTHPADFSVPDDVMHLIALRLVEMTTEVGQYGAIDSAERRAYWAGALSGIGLMSDVFVLLMKPKKAVQHGEEV